MAVRKPDADLLEGGGNEESCAAADAAEHQCFPVFGRYLRPGGFASGEQQVNDQHRSAQIGAEGEEGIGTDIVHACALGHKGGTPDHGGEEQKQDISGGGGFHGATLLHKTGRSVTCPLRVKVRQRLLPWR